MARTARGQRPAEPDGAALQQRAAALLAKLQQLPLDPSYPGPVNFRPEETPPALKKGVPQLHNGFSPETTPREKAATSISREGPVHGAGWISDDGAARPSRRGSRSLGGSVGAQPLGVQQGGGQGKQSPPAAARDLLPELKGEAPKRRSRLRWGGTSFAPPPGPGARTEEGGGASGRRQGTSAADAADPPPQTAATWAARGELAGRPRIEELRPAGTPSARSLAPAPSSAPAGAEVAAAAAGGAVRPALGWMIPLTERVADAESVVGYKTGRVEDLFLLRKLLGRGHSGVVRACVHRESGQLFACKSMEKGSLRSKAEIQDVRQEIEVMEALAGHQNVVELKGVFEDAERVHLVMELCRGGELLAEIRRARHFHEPDAARAFHQVAAAVAHCHARGVLHGDLKPENVVLAARAERGAPPPRLKLADFGLSLFMRPGQRAQGVAGSPYYMAPEVLRGRYGLEADVWSLGVLLYVFLAGFPPFWATSQDGIFAAIRRARPAYGEPAWAAVSPAARALVARLLSKDRKKRPTAASLLAHPWVAKYAAPVDELGGALLPGPPSSLPPRRTAGPPPGRPPLSAAARTYSLPPESLVAKPPRDLYAGGLSPAASPAAARRQGQPAPWTQEGLPSFPEMAAPGMAVTYGEAWALDGGGAMAPAAFGDVAGYDSEPASPLRLATPTGTERVEDKPHGSGLFRWSWRAGPAGEKAAPSPRQVRQAASMGGGSWDASSWEGQKRGLRSPRPGTLAATSSEVATAVLYVPASDLMDPYASGRPVRRLLSAEGSGQPLEGWNYDDTHPDEGGDLYGGWCGEASSARLTYSGDEGGDRRPQHAAAAAPLRRVVSTVDEWAVAEKGHEPAWPEEGVVPTFLPLEMVRMKSSKSFKGSWRRTLLDM